MKTAHREMGRNESGAFTRSDLVVTLAIVAAFFTLIIFPAARRVALASVAAVLTTTGRVAALLRLLLTLGLELFAKALFFLIQHFD